jgi:hypothetical protein
VGRTCDLEPEDYGEQGCEDEDEEGGDDDADANGQAAAEFGALEDVVGDTLEDHGRRGGQGQRQVQ